MKLNKFFESYCTNPVECFYKPGPMSFYSDYFIYRKFINEFTILNNEIEFYFDINQDFLKLPLDIIDPMLKYDFLSMKISKQNVIFNFLFKIGFKYYYSCYCDFTDYISSFSTIGINWLDINDILIKEIIE